MADPDPLERSDEETWCEECGEIGWRGVCPACRAVRSQAIAA